MTRFALSLIALGLAFAPAKALAQAAVSPGVNSGSAAIDLRGVQPDVCRLSGGPQVSEVVNMLVSSRSISETQLAIDLVNPQTGAPNGSVARLSFDMTCTGAHRISVRTGPGLRNTTTVAPAGGVFRSELDYTVQTFWDGQSASANAAGAPGEAVIAEPAGVAGQLLVDINIPGGGAPLIAGEYRDVIIVEVGAAP